jgi:hypothetical protein
MRPLNRPMFRMGGPIKEGIMDGMKEPQAVNTVGNNANRDAMGREKHALFVPFMGLLGQGARMALAPVGRFAMQQIAKRGVTSPGSGLIRSGLGRTRPMTSADSLTTEAMKFKPTAFGKYLLGSPEARAIGAVAKGSGKIGGAIKRVGTSLASSPLTVGFLGLQGFKALGPDKKPVEKAEAEQVKVVDQIGVGEGTTGGSVTGDPDKAKQIQDDRIAKTKKRYYELMGLDNMKKDAAYDSLIDASRIVQEQGADLKGAISKNLDKSADIKRQIDAAILKGEIQKDIASADTTDKRLKEARIKALDRAEKNASVSGQLAAIRSEKGFVPGATTAAILRNEGIKYDTVIQDKLVTDFLEDNPTKTEADYIASLGIQLPDGRYVVGERVVEKKGNEVAFIV